MRIPDEIAGRYLLAAGQTDKFCSRANSFMAKVSICLSISLSVCVCVLLFKFLSNLRFYIQLQLPASHLSPNSLRVYLYKSFR